MQREPLQKLPLEQSPSLAQAVAHVPLVVLQRYAPHADPLTVPHVRAPVHCCGRLSLPTQVALPHEVPVAQVSQAPEPLHEPLWPQVLCASAAHWSRGSVAALALPQTPSPPAVLRPPAQAWQRPVQAVSQQTPSTQ